MSGRGKLRIRGDRFYTYPDAVGELLPPHLFERGPTPVFANVKEGLPHFKCACLLLSHWYFVLQKEVLSKKEVDKNECIIVSSIM